MPSHEIMLQWYMFSPPTCRLWSKNILSTLSSSRKWLVCQTQTNPNFDCSCWLCLLHLMVRVLWCLARRGLLLAQIACFLETDVSQTVFTCFEMQSVVAGKDGGGSGTDETVHQASWATHCSSWNVNIKSGWAAEYLLFSWVMVGSKDSLKVH